MCAHVLYINAFPSYGSPFLPATLTALFFSTMTLKSDPLNWLAFLRNPWLVMSRNFLNAVKIVQIYFRIHRKVSTVKRKHGKLKRISKTFFSPTFVRRGESSWELRTAFRENLWLFSTSIMGFMLQWWKWRWSLIYWNPKRQIIKT